MPRMSGLIWTILILGLVVVAILGVTTKPNITVNPDEERDTISVTGNSELMVDPDQAELYLEIETLEDTAQETKDVNAEIAEEVISALKRAGVKSDHIETYQYRLYPKSEWNENKSKSEVVGYTLQHTLKVTTSDLEKVGTLIDVAVDKGANRVDRVLFTLSEEKEEKVNDQAMEMAAQKGRQKAEALADALDVKLGKITSISESDYYFEPFRYRGEALRETAAPQAKASTEIEPQKLEVRGTVHLVYQLS